MSSPRFVDSLWDATLPIYNRILEHPFLRGLTDGTLPEAAFRHYVLQDAHYLRDFGRGLAVLGAKAGNDDDFMMFCHHGSNAIVVERSLHEGFFKDWGLSRDIAQATPVAPNCLLYASYLVRTAYEKPYCEAIGAFLPCYWIYLKVGQQLLPKSSPHPLYAKWIATYGGEAFGEVVHQVLDAAERAFAPLPASHKHAV